MRGCATILITGFCAAILGCAVPEQSVTFDVPAGRYPAAFDATRDALEAYRFKLDRVDAAAGVISTASKITSGLATPWDREQSGLRAEAEDLINNQSRLVRVTFEPAPADQPEFTASPLVGRVDAWIERTHFPNRRPHPRAAGVQSQATDTALAQRGLSGSFSTPLARDDKLAARLAREISRRLDAAPMEESAPVAMEKQRP